MPANESPETNGTPAARFPLDIVSPENRGFLNSQYANETQWIAPPAMTGGA